MQIPEVLSDWRDQNSDPTTSTIETSFMTSSANTRRTFLKATAGGATAAAMPWFFSTAQTLADETKSDRLSIGVIGAGGMANGNMNSAKDWLNVVAIADVDAGRADSMNQKFSNGKADVYEDYSSILERSGIDMIHVATPDHWHTKPVIEAMLAGKDIYCEKPLTLTIDEGKQIRKVQKETERVVQVGTQQRSTFNLFVKAMAMVADGRVGRIQQVQAAIGGAPTSPEIPVADVPEKSELGPLAGTGSIGRLSPPAAEKWQRARQHELPL